MDVASLKSIATEISPAAVELVAKKAGWPEPTKVVLVESGAEAVANVMNDLGVDAKYAPLVAVGIAAASLVASHYSLKSELQEIAAEVKRVKVEERKAA